MASSTTEGMKRPVAQEHIKSMDSQLRLGTVAQLSSQSRILFAYL